MARRMPVRRGTATRNLTQAARIRAAARRRRVSAATRSATVGYLPAGYHANPKRFSLNTRQKARVRRMHGSLSAATFKRVYGFKK